MELEKRWKELCAQATVENDPQRLSQLVAEIVRLLDLQKAQQKNNDDTKRGTAE